MKGTGEIKIKEQGKKRRREQGTGDELNRQTG